MKKLLFLPLLCLFSACNPDLNWLCDKGYPVSTGAVLIQHEPSQVALETAGGELTRTGNSYQFRLSAYKGNYAVNMSANQRQMLDSEILHLTASWTEGADLKAIPVQISYSRLDAGQSKRVEAETQGSLNFTRLKASDTATSDFSASGLVEFKLENQTVTGSFQIERNQLSRVCTGR